VCVCVCVCVCVRVHTHTHTSASGRNETSAGVSKDLFTMVQGWIYEGKAAALSNAALDHEPPPLYVRRDSDCGRALEVCVGGCVCDVDARAAHCHPH
jgi:hypothetical protein